MKKLSEKQTETLRNLGLSKSQISIYIASLEYGILSVLELSKITKISRQQIYDDTEKLIELGLLEITRKQGKKYIPAPASKLSKLAEKKIASLQSILFEINNMVPALEELSTEKRNKVRVKYFEGLDKIKEAYEEELFSATNTEILSLAGLIDNVFDYFPEKYWEKWNQKFVQSKSTTRMLVHNSDIAKKHSLFDKAFKRETRYLERFPLKVNIDIFNNTVLIVSFTEQFAVWIDSEVISQSYRIMFNTLWYQAKSF